MSSRSPRFSSAAWILCATSLLPACADAPGDGVDAGVLGSGGTDGSQLATGGASVGGSSTGGQPFSGGTSGVGGQLTGSGGLGSGGGFQGSGGLASSGGSGTGGLDGGGSGSGGLASGGAGSGGTDSGGTNSGGANSGGASGTGGSSSGCGVEPANPNSNQTVRNLLCYLYDIYGEQVLSGQQDCHWSASSDVEYVADRTGGEYPAIVGGDFLYDNAVSQATQSWNAGGLSMIRYHMGRPLDADSYESSLAQMSESELNDTLTPGTARHNSLLGKFDHAASELGILQNAGVVVIWAPFHESQPDGWFWWSQGTGEQLKALWELMFDDFNARGLNNLIWLFPFSGEPDASFYPNPALLDFAGPDTYGSGQPFAGMYDDAVDVIGTEVPIALHETGTIVSPDAMFQNNQAPWVLFSVWCDTYLRQNSDSAIAAAYASSRTISRGDLPDFSP